MLVLSRRSGECVRIGKDIKLSVLGVRGDRVRLGFSAPETVRIRRAELKPNRRTKTCEMDELHITGKPRSPK